MRAEIRRRSKMIKKTVFTSVVLMLCTAQLAWAASVRLSWSPNTETDLAGYKLGYGTSPRTQTPYTQTVVINDRNATSWPLTLSPGVYYFGLRAFDASGNDSGFSAEVTAEVTDLSPPGQPGQPFLVP
jgi:chitinase